MSKCWTCGEEMGDGSLYLHFCTIRCKKAYSESQEQETSQNHSVKSPSSEISRHIFEEDEEKRESHLVPSGEMVALSNFPEMVLKPPFSPVGTRVSGGLVFIAFGLIIALACFFSESIEAWNWGVVQIPGEINRLLLVSVGVAVFLFGSSLVFNAITAKIRITNEMFLIQEIVV